MKKTELIGLIENIISKVLNENIEEKSLLDDIINIKWMYPVYNDIPYENRLYKLIVQDKDKTQHIFRTMSQFNKFFGISAPSSNYNEFKDFMLNIHKSINIEQTEFDIS